MKANATVKIQIKILKGNNAMYKHISPSERGYFVDGDYYNAEGEKLSGVRKTFNSSNILEVTACTTGLRGGDSGHGCRTVVKLMDLGGTDIEILPIRDGFSNGGVELHLGGDCELLTLIDGLRFAADTLEELSRQ